MTKFNISLWFKNGPHQCFEIQDEGDPNPAHLLGQLKSFTNFKCTNGSLVSVDWKEVYLIEVDIVVPSVD